MYPAMMAIFGSVVGAGSMLMKSYVDHALARRAVHIDRRMQALSTVASQRADTVAEWRAGLQQARDVYRDSLATHPDGGAASDVVGDMWFESLRPYLSDETLRSADKVICDNPTIAAISLEIGRVEREWLDQATN